MTDRPNVWTIPEGEIQICERKYQDDVNITGLILPASLEEIGAGAFWGCKNLEFLIYK